MIVLLGASGYVGQAFREELVRRKTDFIPLSRKDLDYTRFELLIDFLKTKKPEFVINSAGFTGRPNVDACETARAETLLGNTLLPQSLAHACAVLNISWAHISSGCIYDGAKIFENGKARIQKNLNAPEFRKILDKSPAAIRGFSEQDEPNFSFRRPPCSFYSGTKALAEEAIAGVGRSYLLRLRIPFDDVDNPRNYLTKLQRYPKLYDNVNSISHRGEAVRACLDLWERRAPFGIYNLTNPGFISTRQVAALIEKYLKPGRKFEFWESDEEFYRCAAKTPRSNCILDVSKLISAGAKMRPVEEALEDSIAHWKQG